MTLYAFVLEFIDPQMRVRVDEDGDVHFINIEGAYVSETQLKQIQKAMTALHRLKQLEP
jgi:hypothetical protein